MHIVSNRTIFYTISGILGVLSLTALFLWGLNLGIDFKGGSIIEVEYQSVRPEQGAADASIATLGLGAFSLRPIGERGFILRTKTLSEAEHMRVLDVVSKSAPEPLEEKRFDSIGPLLGAEASRKAFVSVTLVIFGIVLFITFAFRQVSEPISSWKYGLISIVALVHDVLIPTGAMAMFGHFLGYEADTLFVTALLVILGFSVHDTIVVFDRVREHLKSDWRGKKKGNEFEKIVNDSVNETFTRSVNTSLTTLLALLALYFLGADATRHFALVLIIGIIAGTYSSIFIASPLLVTVEKWQNKR